MSTEQKNKERIKPEYLWRSIFEETKESLRKNDAIKAGIIQRCCAMLEEKGMPISMICGRVIRELAEFASRRYLYEVIEDKYKEKMRIREYHKQEPEQSTTPSAPNEGKKNTEDKKNTTKEMVEIIDGDSGDPKVEIKGPYQTINLENVEEYNIEDLERYSKETLIEIIKYLHDHIERQTTSSSKRE